MKGLIRKDMYFREDHYKMIVEMAEEYERDGERTTPSELVRIAIYRFLVQEGRIVKNTEKEAGNYTVT